MWCMFVPVHRHSRSSPERGGCTALKVSLCLRLLSDSVGSCDHLPAEEGRRSDVLHEHQDHTQENEDEGEDEHETDAEDLRARSIARVEGVKKKHLTERNHCPRKYHTAAKAVSP